MRKWQQKLNPHDLVALSALSLTCMFLYCTEIIIVLIVLAGIYSPLKISEDRGISGPIQLQFAPRPILYHSPLMFLCCTKN